MLCVSIEGKYAIINNDGDIVQEFITTQDTDYKPGLQVHFCKRTPGNRLLFACGNIIYYSSLDNTRLMTIKLAETATYNMGEYILSDNSILFCVTVENSAKSTLHYVDALEDVNHLITKVIGTTSDGNITVESSSTFPLFTNSSGKVITFNTAFNIQKKVWQESNYNIYHYGNISSVTQEADKYVLTMAMEEKAFTAVSALSEYLQLLSTTLDDYSLYAVMGNNSSYWVHVDDIWDTRSVPDKYFWITIDLIFWRKSWQVVLSWKDEAYISVAAHDERHQGQYNTLLLDGVSQNITSNVGIDLNGKYLFGQFGNIGNNFRLLYNNGVATAISTTSDKSIMGSLLCGYTELNSAAPICHGNLSNGEFLCFKNVSGMWEIIELVADPTEFDMKVLNNRYLLINTNEYYNCYDTEEHRPHHFSPDYNNRAILSVDYTNSASPKTLSGYINICEQWNVGTGQGANYEVLNTPFISALWTQITMYLPKGITNWKVNVQGSYTPDDLDIDIYYRKLVDGSATYQYSIDQSSTYARQYINSNLSGTVYQYMNTTYIPTIFAEFVSGFINQGIILDNGHSYLQLYANSTKPVFGIKLVSQLEGIEAACIIQGQYFVIINGAIYRYDPNTYTLSAVVNIGNMKLVGYTPYQALFWSDTNKTFYTFTGDNMLNVLVQADEIKDIITTAYNPNTMSLYVLTDDSIYIFGTNQLIRLEISGYTKCFPLNNGAVFVGDDALYISYNKMEGYEPLPIELETELYGLGNNIKSVNDCVYMRFFNRDGNTGKIKLRAQTLNEGTFNTEEKEFNVTSDMWDKESGTLFLRFQPKYQVGTGFSVKIESPFAIASLQISSTPETVQNSKYNV